MYLKVYYPIVFWSVAINNDKDGKQIPLYISEINKTGNIKILPQTSINAFTAVYTDFKVKRSTGL